MLKYKIPQIVTLTQTVGKQTAAGMQKNGIHRMKVADTVSRLTMQSECLRMS